MLRRICATVLAVAFVVQAAAAPAPAAGATPAASPDVLRNRVNQGTVAIISGGVNGTYIRIASDLAAVLDKGDQLRVLPIVGKGSLQNITDLLYLRGIDIGIVQSDVLGFIRKERLHPNIEQRIRYVTKLYNEEVHVLGTADTESLADLEQKKVNVDVVGSGTAMTASTLFDTLGIRIEPTHYDQALALEKLKSGEIAAMVYVAGKPTDLFRRVEAGNRLRFLPVPLTPELLQIYLPSSLGHDDYPSLLGAGQSIDTVAVGAVMAVYNWEPNSERYRRVGAFVEAFFDGFGEFLKPPRHPKWKEVNLAATLPGWTRFRPAEEWLQRLPSASLEGGYDVALKSSFDEFLKFMHETGGGRRAASMSPQERELLFARFLEWREKQEQGTRQPPPASTGAAAPAAAAADAPR